LQRLRKCLVSFVLFYLRAHGREALGGIIIIWIGEEEEAGVITYDLKLASSSSSHTNKQNKQTSN
jgi:hypothetical protein